METTTAAKTSMDVLISLYDFHTKLFYNVTVDISDKDADNRLGTKANHVAWLAGSLVHARYALANAVGIDSKQTSDRLFENNKGIMDDVTYPPLEEFKKDWKRISPVLKDALVRKYGAEFYQTLEATASHLSAKEIMNDQDKG